jgi:hypothetical protein
MQGLDLSRKELRNAGICAIVWVLPQVGCGASYRTRKESRLRFLEDDMIDFDEELKKYTPNMEISEAEEAVLSREITDAADVIERILQERKELK